MIWIILAALLALAVVVAVSLAESAVRVQPDKRVAAPDAVGEEVARRHGALFQAAEITAGDGTRLRGWWMEPEGAREVVLVVHGFTNHRQGMLRHVEMFLRNGIAVLVADHRGHGASEGEVVSFGLRESEDFRLWCDWVEHHKGVGTFAAFGQSMGAAVVVLALDRERRLECVVAEACYTGFVDVAMDRVADRFRLHRRLGRILLRPVGELALAYARLRYGLRLRRVVPIEAIREARIPVLLVHGSSDGTIPPDHSRRLHAANREWTEHWEVEGAAHTTSIEAGGDEYERRVVGWLTRRRGENRALARAKRA